MWNCIYIRNTVIKFLPYRAEIIMLGKPYRRPAVLMSDLDGDGVLEIVAAYYYQGEIYIMILKYCYNNWYYLANVLIKTDNLKGEKESIDKALSSEYPYISKEKLIRLKKQILQRKSFNQQEIDLSSIKYIYSEADKDMKLEEALMKAFNLDESERNIRYYYNKTDLNDDGNPETFVYLTGPFVCGTGGCSAALFKQENGEYKLISRFSLVRNPVIISNTKTNGYRDIIMKVSGGGIESFYAWVKYDGITYPGNPSVQPKVRPGTKVYGIAVIADDITVNPGIEIS